MEERDYYAEVREILEDWNAVTDVDSIRSEVADILDIIEAE